MYEVEVKARVKDPSAIINYLISKGFSKQRYSVKDQYFNHPCRDFAAEDKELRLRIEKKDSDTRILLTYKGPSLRGDRSVRREIEVSIESLDILDILENLGFNVYITKEKDGYFFSKDGINVYLCFVKGSVTGKTASLGYFIEVEKIVSNMGDIEKAREEVIRFLSEIPGVGEIEMRYYTEMIHEKTRY